MAFPSDIVISERRITKICGPYDIMRCGFWETAKSAGCEQSQLKSLMRWVEEATGFGHPVFLIKMGPMRTADSFSL